MKTCFKSTTSSASKAKNAPRLGLLKMGVVAAATVLAGGLVATWWYRKTLKTLRQAEDRQSEGSTSNPHYGIPEDDSTDEA
jgi:hypothetical protein